MRAHLLDHQVEMTHHQGAGRFRIAVVLPAGHELALLLRREGRNLRDGSSVRGKPVGGR
jgi:hypothetical protein